MLTLLPQKHIRLKRGQIAHHPNPIKIQIIKRGQKHWLMSICNQHVQNILDIGGQLVRLEGEFAVHVDLLMEAAAREVGAGELEVELLL